VGLLWSADRFVEGSAAAAGNLGISKLIIGLTVVAFGTSAPEVIVSISSALRGAGDLAIGNAIGSNLANIGLVLGTTALVAALPIKGHILKQEFPIMLAVMAISGWFLHDNKLSFYEGLCLVTLLVPLMAWIAYSKKHHPEEEETIPNLTMGLAITWFCVGLALLIISAEILVWGATAIAVQFSVSPLIIGLTIVAIGTSLPELAASIVSALKGHHDIALGNVIGSNIFNLLLVMGIPAIINPIDVERQAFSRDFMGMVLITLVLGASMWFIYLRGNDGQCRLGKIPAVLLIALYISYYFVLFQ